MKKSIHALFAAFCLISISITLSAQNSIRENSASPALASQPQSETQWLEPNPDESMNEIADWSHPQFKLYPNPGISYSILEVYSEPGEEIDIEVFSTLGTRMFSYKVFSFDEKTSVKIDMTSYKNGMYLVRMKINGHTYTKQLFKK